MERAGHQAQLAHALTAKRRMEGRHKTDERDARGLAMLLRTARCRGCGFRPPNCATSAKCCAGACAGTRSVLPSGKEMEVPGFASLTALFMESTSDGPTQRAPIAALEGFSLPRPPATERR